MKEISAEKLLKYLNKEIDRVDDILRSTVTKISKIEYFGYARALEIFKNNLELGNFDK